MLTRNAFDDRESKHIIMAHSIHKFKCMFHFSSFCQVKIGAFEGEENLDIADPVATVLAADPSVLQFSWAGRDSESGVMEYMVGVGTAPDDASLTPGGTFISAGRQTSITLTGLNMPVTEDSGNYYYATVYLINGANLESVHVSSKRVSYPYYTLQLVIS